MEFRIQRPYIWHKGTIIPRVNMRFKVVLESAEEGGYTVFVPSLPGCISEGNTREEALENIREAIELYLESKDEDIAVSEGVELAEVII